MDNDLKLVVLFGIVGVMENIKDINEKQYNALKDIYMSLSEDIDALPDDRPDEEVIQEFIQGIASIQEKLEAYNDLEYSEEE